MPIGGDEAGGLRDGSPQRGPVTEPRYRGSRERSPPEAVRYSLQGLN